MVKSWNAAPRFHLPWLLAPPERPSFSRRCDCLPTMSLAQFIRLWGAHLGSPLALACSQRWRTEMPGLLYHHLVCWNCWLCWRGTRGWLLNVEGDRVTWGEVFLLPVPRRGASGLTGGPSRQSATVPASERPGSLMWPRVYPCWDPQHLSYPWPPGAPLVAYKVRLRGAK